MARKDKPYLPLYVQDFMTDEKLNECSASATGVYIKVMCLMHKSETYGVILLNQKDKQTNNQIENFALKLAKHISFDLHTILAALEELTSEKVLSISGDKLTQKRMFEDGKLSVKRSKSGSKGGETTQKLAKANIEASNKPKFKASPDIDIDINNTVDINKEIDSKDDDNSKKGVEKFCNYPNGESGDLKLPDTHIEKAIEYLDINKQIKKSKGQISVMWDMFKLENFTGKNFYENEGQIFTHFLRTLKSEKGGQSITSRGNKSNSKVSALKQW